MPATNQAAPQSSRSVVEEILALFESAGQSAYLGEAVTQLEHALQCAQLARDAGADNEMMLAALLHDIGHLCAPAGPEGVGVVDHDEAGARYLRERGFSRRLTALVGGHVAAKRYLTATNPSYFNTLSPTSVTTLRLQGGPMNPDEASAFECDVLAADKLQLRSWDEAAKRPGWKVAPISSYRDLLLAHLNRKEN